MENLKSTAAEVAKTYDFTVMKNGTVIKKFQSSSPLWKDLSGEVSSTGEYTPSQHEVICLNNGLSLELPSGSIEGVPSIEGMAENEVVFMIFPKDSKGGASRSELYQQVKEIITSRPDLKAEIGNYTQVPSADIEVFIQKYGKGSTASSTSKAKPVVLKEVTAPKTTPKSLSDLSDEELMAEMQRRKLGATQQVSAPKEDPLQKAAKQMSDEYFRNHPNARRW